MNHLSKTLKQSILRSLVVGSIGALPISLTGAQISSVENTEPEERSNEVTIGLGLVDFETGSNESLFQEHQRLKDGGTGGIEQFYWANDSDRTYRLFIEGHWLPKEENLALNLELTDKEKLFFNIDYYHWVDFDYGAGIYDPSVDFFSEFAEPSLAKEINRLDLNLRYQLTEEIRAELGYRFFRRDGESLSTIFGDTYAFTFGGPRSRGIIPSVINRNEVVHAFDGALVRQTSDNETGLRLHYQSRSVTESRISERSSEKVATNRYTTQKSDSGDDLFATSFYQVHNWNEDSTGSVGFAYTHLDGTLTGSRIFGATPEAQYDPAFAAIQLNDRGFLDLDNSRKLQQWIFNLNASLRQTKDLRVLFGGRFEHLSSRTFSSYLDTFDRIDWSSMARQDEEADMLSSNRKNASKYTGFMELKYTGFSKFQLFSRVESSLQKGDLDESSTREEISPDVRSPIVILDRESSFEQKYLFSEAGVNWIPTTGMRLTLKGYIKSRNNEYTERSPLILTALSGEYPGFVQNQDTLTQDVNLRFHWNAWKGIKSVTRVDLQNIEIDTLSRGNPEIRSSETERFIFSQSISWLPHYRIFLMGTVNYVENLTKTGAAELQGHFADVIVNLPSDYWQGSLDVYFILSKRMDLQLQYSYLEMSNYFDNSGLGIAYGEDLTQHHASADLIMRFTPNLVGKLGYQYFENDQPSTSGYSDYRVHLIKTSLQFIF